MYEPQTLEIIGHRERPVAHTLFRQEDEVDRLAVLLPGLGYNAFMPLLHYPMRMFLASGMDVLRVEYAYNRQAEYQTLTAAEQARWLFTDASAACRCALECRPYRRITLVGKSLGTLAMGYLFSAEVVPASAQAIWLTPLLWNDMLRAQIRQFKPRSLFVTGTADPHYNAAYLAELQTATRGEAVVIDGANHSLEVKDDVFQSLQAIDKVLKAIQAFLGASGLG